MNTIYRKIFEPFRLDHLQLKNRLVMAPMGTRYGDRDGSVNRRVIDYYEARARGGTGLIIVEGTAPGMQCSLGSQLTLGDDRYIKGWKDLAVAIHQHAAKVAVQLHHSGMELRDGQPVQVSPSPVIVPGRNIGLSGKPPYELTVEEISGIVQWFAQAARRAREAGIDGVEIHGAHQYIVASFLSSASNARQDQYGGSIENKARFPVEILLAVREAAGPDYPVWIRLNAQEYGIPNGITIEETKQVVPILAAAGARAIHVSAYGAGSYCTKAPQSDTPGLLLPLATEVKKITNLPVIAVGRLDMETGERALIEGKADLIAVGRRLLADPDLPNKAKESQLDDIRPCIGCLECVEGLFAREGGLGCSVNPTVGRERDYRLFRAHKVKKVIVVGGGPAGLETATVAALRGHRVLLIEKELKLGGLLNVASLPPNKDDIVPWAGHLERQARKAGVEIVLGTQASRELIQGMHPEAVVIATGGFPVIPPIPGIDNATVVTAQDVLAGKVTTGPQVVVLGGGMVGCETGYFLAVRGKKVAIVEVLKRLAGDMGPMVRRRLMDGLRYHQVTMLTETKCEGLTPGHVTVITGEGQRSVLPADTVIIAAGYQPERELYGALKDIIPELYCIGDAARTQGIREATLDGYRTGLSL